MAIALTISAYLLFGPPRWLFELMDLTEIPLDFKLFLLVLGIGGFCISYVSELYLFRRLALVIGEVRKRLGMSSKKRKQYKIIQESTRL
jgi:cation-transporting P-type ATPase 13A2